MILVDNFNKFLFITFWNAEIKNLKFGSFFRVFCLINFNFNISLLKNKMHGHLLIVEQRSDSQNINFFIFLLILVLNNSE